MYLMLVAAPALGVVRGQDLAVRHACGFDLIECRRPACEEVQRLLRLRTGLGGVDEQHQACVGCKPHRLESEFEVADDRVMEALDAGVVEANVVRRPPSAERVAPRRELADEVRKATVVRVAASFRAQDRDGVGRNLLPVDVEVGRARVEEDEARRIASSMRCTLSRTRCFAGPRRVRGPACAPRARSKRCARSASSS